MTRNSDTNAGAQKERKKPGRVPTSCAECRRLKLRCDRKVPCENCLKRGCGAICPNGSLTTGKGNRLILANTEELHNKIEIMTARIRELEDALRTSHADLHDDEHPLLGGTISVVSQTSIEEGSPESSGSPPPAKSPSDPVIDAFGTLSIGTRGETTFMSSTARSEYLIQPSLTDTPCISPGNNLQFSRLSRRVLDAWNFGSDLEIVDDDIRKLVMSYRPPLSEAIRLCEIYLDWNKILWCPLSRHELFDELLGSVYGAETYESIPGPHALSLLFSVFALASLFDFERPAYNVDAYDYHVLCRVSLDFKSPLKTTTLHTVQAVLNSVHYLESSDLGMDPSRTYIYVGLAVKLAYKMGLHLHSARFQLDESQIRKRSEIFWQIFMMDTLLSFSAGRPPIVSQDWIDVPYPEDDFAVMNDKGELEMSWRSWSWRWSRLLHEVLVAAFGAKIPTYNTILDLDRKIRDFPIPPHLQLKCPRNHPGVERSQINVHFRIQGLMVLTMKELTLLNIHRRYFSQALQESPNNMLKHKYGPSVMAMYRSAWRLIVGHSHAVEQVPNMMSRMNIFWSQAFSAAVVMCMIVTKAPNSNLAASSLHELDVVYEVFKKSAPTTKIASVFLEPVTKIWRKGHETIDVDGVLSRAELDRVGGGSTSLISGNSSNASSPSSHTASSETSPHAHAHPIQAGPSTSNSPFDATTLSIHPRIMQDMQSFDGYPSYSLDVPGRPHHDPHQAHDYHADHAHTPPSQFSYSLMDTQFPQPVQPIQPTHTAHITHNAHNAHTSGLSVEACTTHAHHAHTLNTFPAAQPLPFHSGAGSWQADGMVLDSAWQSFVEQLGF